MKRDWTVIDKRASQATEKDAQTFEKLVKFLEAPVKYSPDRDIYMTRGLLYWLKCNAHQKGDHGQDSPLTLAARMFTGKQAYAEAFAELCKKANIQCEMVSGISKTGDYEPGDIEIDRERMQAYWNKVRLLGRWWPIHPRYVLRAVRGSQQHTGKSGNQQTEFTFNDFWFLTSPEIFLNKCFPDKAEDQMLPTSKRLKNTRQFMKLPYLTPVFHEYKLKLTSEESCIIDSIDGLARISFKGPRTTVKDMVCSFTLQVHNHNGSEQEDIDFETSRLVFSSRKKNRFIFEVRCPVEGSYQLVVFGGKTESKKKKVLLRCKIVCLERMSDVRILPVDVGQTGWGFGPTAAEAGLSKPNIKEPKVFIQPKSAGMSRRKTTVRLRFTIAEDAVSKFQYDAELCPAGESMDDMEEYLSIDTVSEKLKVDCSVPEHGEYALVIKAKSLYDSSFNPVCYYLLTTLEDRAKMSDDYYDSSDGTSDIDEEIEQLENTLREITIEKDQSWRGLSRQ